MRRTLRRTRQSLRYGRSSLNQSPVLFANSFPKSGTHLLTQVLAGFCRIGPAVESGLPAIVTYNGVSGRQRDIQEILLDLYTLQPGDTAFGHLHAVPQLVDLLCSPGYACYFVLRDPRDVVVSHVHYITDMAEDHIHQNYFKNELADFDARLRFSIAGSESGSLSGKSAPLPDICSRFEPYLDWLSHPEILTLRFEDLVNQTRRTLEQIVNHATQRGFTIKTTRDEALEILESNINPSRSPTFRKGTSGAWRSAFSPENKQLFKDITGDLLVQLGYEENQDW